MFSPVAHHVFCAYCSNGRSPGRSLKLPANCLLRAFGSGRLSRQLGLVLKSASGPCPRRSPAWKTSFGYDVVVQILSYLNALGFSKNGVRSTKSDTDGDCADRSRRAIPLVVICKVLVKGCRS